MAVKHNPAHRAERGPGEEDLQHLGRGSTLKIVGALSNTLMAFGMIVIVTRGYGQDAAGVYFATTTLFLLIGQAAEAGADQSVLRYIPQLRATGRGGDVRALLRRIGRHVLITSAAGALIALLFAPFLGRALSESSDYQAVINLIKVIVPFIPMIAITEVALAATRGYQSMRPSVLIYDISVPMLQVGLALLARSLWPHRVLPLTLSFLVPYAVSMAWALWALRRLMRQDHRLAPTPDGRVQDYWKFTIPRAAARICQYALRRIDVVIVAAMAGPKDAAVYTAITRFITVGSVGVQAVQQVAQPKLGELLELRDHPRIREVFRTTTIWLVVASWPVFVLFGIFPGTALHALGNDYVRGAAALALLCAAQLIVVATGPVDIVLVMTGRSGLSLSNQVISLIVDVALCVALVPHWGVTGAALAKVIALLVNNLVASVQVFLQQRLHPLCRGMAVAGLGCLVTVGGCCLIARALLGQTFLGMLAGFLVGSATYLGLCVLERRSLRLDSLVDSLRGTSRGTHPHAPVPSGTAA
jgi:O-antigen/teichoic acid export membrane protein